MILGVVSSSSTQALWYLTRATGLVSLVLLTLVMVLGISPGPTLDVGSMAPVRHRRACTANVSLLAVMFLAGPHLDRRSSTPTRRSAWSPRSCPSRRPTARCGSASGRSPSTSSSPWWSPACSGHRIDHGLWRTIHWAAYACWPLALRPRARHRQRRPRRLGAGPRRRLPARRARRAWPGDWRPTGRSTPARRAGGRPGQLAGRRGRDRLGRGRPDPGPTGPAGPARPVAARSRSTTAGSPPSPVRRRRVDHDDPGLRAGGSGPARWHRRARRATPARPRWSSSPT